MSYDTDTIVVGGGLAGLTAATILGRAGQSVILFERSREVGGRARTADKDGFLFNQGPHALYRAGVGLGVLRELGIPFTGGVPSAGGYAIHRGKKYALPDGVLALLRTRLLRLPAKIEAVRLLRSLRSLDPMKHRHLSAQEWLENTARHSELRELLAALFRLVTYSNDPTQLSVSVALRQFQMAFFEGGVYYLDGGWQVLVDGLRKAARESGVKIVSEAKVHTVERDNAVRGVRLGNGSFYGASSVIIAASPAVASKIVAKSEETVLRRWAEAAVPVRVASLDVALRHLPDGRAVFALGIDRPTYLSVHSAVGRLAPEGGAVIHVAKYLGSSSPTDPRSDERELEELLDIMQPGWRNVLVYRRFLPNMVASNALVTAAQGGTAGRPGPEVPGIPRLYVAGDWVGTEGWLSDASLASGKRAAELILREEIPVETIPLPLVHSPLQHPPAGMVDGAGEPSGTVMPARRIPS